MNAVERFLAAEVVPLGLHSSGPASLSAVGGIGTMAPKVLGTWNVAHTVVRADPAELVADQSWQLAVVLSPWKHEVAGACSVLSPSAAATGVVDTVLRVDDGTVGLNTNTWAAEAAITTLAGDRPPASVVLVGSGASARSVALAVRRCWPDADLAVVARRPEAAAALAEEFSAAAVDSLPAAAPAASGSRSLVVNATTWGETDTSEEEPLAVDLSSAWGPGVALFDLNNRVGSLPRQALAGGAVVASGALMQKSVNAMRLALAPYAAPPAP